MAIKLSFLGVLFFFFQKFSVTALPTDIPSPRPPSDDEESLIVLLVSLIISLVFVCAFLIGIALAIRLLVDLLAFRPVQLDNQIPGSLDDEFEIEERIRELSPNEQNLFRSGQEYLKQNPHYLTPLTLSEHMIIQERGIEAWEFIPDYNLSPDAIFVQNKTELNFTNFDYQCSIQTNLPIPKINDVYYYEMKIFNLDSPEDTIISAGLSTRPYPYFRLPGRHLYSISYDSTGSRRYCNSFKLTEAESIVFPKLIQGDVIGIGYRVRSGTIFFTRNGKKLSEKSIGGHIKGMRLENLYPTVGANNPCSVHVNLGQGGYVFIEANIKKWGYAAKEGNRPPLPSYNYSSNDLLLESSNEDDESISPPDFFKDVGYESCTSRDGSIAENFSLNTIEGLPREPPLYISEEEEEDRLLYENTTRNQFVGGEETIESENATETIISSEVVPNEEDAEIEISDDDDDDKSINHTDNNINGSTNTFNQDQSQQNIDVASDEDNDKNNNNNNDLLELPEDNQYESNILVSEEMESRDDIPI